MVRSGPGERVLGHADVFDFEVLRDEDVVDPAEGQEGKESLHRLAMLNEKLRIVDTLLTSTPRLIANHNSWKDAWKRKKIETLALLLRGALEAEAKVGLKMNIEQSRLADLLKKLPALRNPTISQLSLPGWVAVETIIDEHVVRELIPQLKAAGAEGIIEYPLNKVVY